MHKKRAFAARDEFALGSVGFSIPRVSEKGGRSEKLCCKFHPILERTPALSAADKCPSHGRIDITAEEPHRRPAAIAA